MGCPMTHDELLAKIDEPDHWFKPFLEIRQALRAVVELHEPWSYTFSNGNKYEYCRGCPLDIENGHPEWPCPTIQAIEKELQ
jgi:hypothetical protein